MKHLFRFLTIISAVTMISKFTYAQNLERKDVPDKYKWDNSILYKNIDEWQKDRELIERQIDKLKTYQDKMGESADNFYSTLRLFFDIYKSFYKLSDYSARVADEDLRISSNQSLNQQATILGTKLGEVSAFINPEILKIEPEKIKKFFDEKKELNEFKFFVDDILRLREHTLSTREEEILASAGLITSTPDEVYGIFDNAEKPNAKVKLSTGEEVELSSSAYT